MRRVGREIRKPITDFPKRCCSQEHTIEKMHVSRDTHTV